MEPNLTSTPVRLLGMGDRTFRRRLEVTCCFCSRDSVGQPESSPRSVRAPSRNPSAVERALPLPIREAAHVVLPIAHAQLEIGGGKVVAERLPERSVTFERPQRIEQIQWEAADAFQAVAFFIHVDVETLTRIPLLLDPVEPGGEQACLHEVRIG